jgi:uncharacterized protein YabN with tetrapyrrole methylase and pyrophosphatase domain
VNPPPADQPPPSPDARAIDRLLELMERLRAPGGCPWDREQTPASLKPQLLEECYEVLEAIDSGSAPDLSEELGDLLLHVVFQAQIARENGAFTFAEVANGISEKLVRRHPHVFGADKVAGAAEVVTLWNDLKRAEKPERASALDGVPRALPALLRAEALQKKARQVGFDSPRSRQKSSRKNLPPKPPPSSAISSSPWSTSRGISSSTPRSFSPPRTTNSTAVSAPWRNASS